MEIYIWHNDWELNVPDRSTKQKICELPLLTRLCEYLDTIRAFSAFYDSIKIVASAVVGATFALAIRKDFTLNLSVGAFAFAAVFLALLCSFESRRLDEDENVQVSKIVLFAVVVLALVIACRALTLSVEST